MATLDPAALRRWTVHLPGRAAPPVGFAGTELQRYLELLTGARIAVTSDMPAADACTIVLGASDVAGMHSTLPSSSSFVVSPEPNQITLAAGSPRALLDAAYTLLEQLGCRWSLYGSSEEVVPQLTGAVALQLIARTPRFAVRGYSSDIMTWHYTQPEYLQARDADDRTFIDWMGKSGANAFLFIRHPFDTQLTIPELLPEFERRGINLEYGGHVIPLLLPRELFREHPDYFPQSPAGARSDFGNLCTSNPGALAVASANAVEYVRRYPEMSAIHIWGADLWHGGWCGCAECMDVSVQDQSLRVCNAVARALAEAGVSRPVCYLAYHDTIEPNLTLCPDPNVIVEFAPRERCYGHALNDPACATNRHYAAALERYAELFDGRMRLFEYYGDAILFFGCAVPLAEVIAADLEYYRRLGAPGITMLQFGRFSQWAYPLNFLAFAAGTISGGGTETLSHDYCARFGAQAPHARAMLAELEVLMRSIVTYGDIRRPPRSLPPAQPLLTEVEAAVPRLARLSSFFRGAVDPELRAQAALLQYTHTVLQGVRDELERTVSGNSLESPDRFAEALRIIEAVDARFKGLWGSVDLPIIHSIHAGGLAFGP